MNGLAGISCFFFHYYNFTREEKYKTHGYLALEKVLKSIDNGFFNPSFASGLAGVYWVFQYLGRKGFISTEEAGTLDGLKPMLISFAESKFQQGEYDYLHGALGVYTALQAQIANEHFHSDVYLDNLTNTIIRELTRLAIKNPDKSIFWESEDFITGLKEINLGLAHGLPSILLILSRIYAYTKNTALLNDLIEPGMNFLLSNRIENNHSFSVFPIRLIDGIAQSPSRMAW
jgi:lantibiotic modifying enzyme